MIVPMKKVHLVTQDKDIVPALNVLREAGVLHVEHMRAAQGQRLTQLTEDRQMLARVVSLLTHEKQQPYQVTHGDWKAKAEEILGLAIVIDQYQEAINKRHLQIVEWEPWGDFNPEDLEFLRRKGLTAELVEVPEKELYDADGTFLLRPIFSRHKVVRCLAVAKGQVKVPYRIVSPPAVSLGKMKEVQKETYERLREAQQQLLRDSQYVSFFRHVLAQVEEEIVYQQVYAGKGEADRLAFIRGFCPQDLCAFLEKVARDQHWGLMLEDPSSDDQVPTLIRGPRWAEMIKPVFQFMNILPGYREMDVSAAFLLFFSIFYGMLIGDAGYGLLFIGLTLAAQRKWKDKADPKVFSLLHVLNGVTVVWGLLTGTFFGQHFPGLTLPPLWPWLTKSENVQLVCFLIGAVHLSLAHLWRMILLMPSRLALAELGAFLLVWYGFLLSRFLILEVPLPWFHKFVVVAGSLLLIFFGKPHKNIWISFGAGFGDYLLRVVSFFSDIVSYIRLFAVGYASVLLADTFNEIAAGLGFRNPLVGLGSAMILVIGHSANIILGGLSILVHGLRLNILEFSGHLGLEWAGFSYHPFKKTRL